MTERTIYVVRGEAGEYSGRVEWLVAAFTNEIAARDRVKACTAHIRSLANTLSEDDKDDIEYGSTDAPYRQELIKRHKIDMYDPKITEVAGYATFEATYYLSKLTLIDDPKYT